MNGRIPIKEIVALFESGTEVAQASTSPIDSQRSQLLNHPQQSGPPPSPARFIQHPLLKKPSSPTSPSTPVRKPKVSHTATSPNEQQLLVETAHENNVGHPIIPNFMPISSLGKRIDHYSPPANNNDRRDPVSGRSPQRFMTRRMSPAISPKSQNSSVSYIPLVPVESSTFNKEGESASSRPPFYQSLDRLAAPLSQTTLTDTKLLNDTIYKDDYDHNDFDVKLISSSPLHPVKTQTQTPPPPPSPQQQQHTPIAAKTIFSREAAPLSLPALDNYLSQAQQPNFTPFPTIHSPGSGRKAPQPSVFPPLDLLQASKRTLSDIENNATVPSWFQDRGAIFSSLLSVSLGIMGSSPISMYYSLQGLYDSLQLTALLLSTIVSHNQTDESDWRQVLLGTIPNILALNLGNTAVSLILFVILMIISACLLYYFHIQTKRISSRISSLEGLQAPPTSGKWGLVLSTFFLSVIYLPLSTISVHAIVWSSDFWPNSAPRTSSVCFTTTLDPNEINFGPPIVILAILTVTFLTIWFPIRLGQAIKTAIPTINKYTNLGRLRNRVELRHAYERMLERDTNPISFLYQDLRLGWATYSSIYLWIKLSTLLLVAVFDPNNCIFMHTNSYVVTIIRQVLLLLAMIAFLVVQTIFGPFLNPVSNASEWCSRLGYVVFALFGLIVALHVPTSVQNLFNGPFLYIAYVLEYTFVFYFFLINFNSVQALVKKITRRMDFSIDIFSPKLDISPTSRHTRRRIWQESISVLSLLTPECMMSKNEKLVYTDLKTLPVPPYLIRFRGTVGERHVENLKILGEMGGMDYAKGIALCTGTRADRFRELEHRIQAEFTGPDCYWRDPKDAMAGGSFGNAWWIPFPPTLVMKYDSGSTIALKTLDEFEEYVRQNDDEDVSYRRRVRFALRSLDGQVIRWPYTHIQNVGKKFGLFQKRYTAYSTVRFESGVFTIQHNGSLPWKTIDLGSGFNVKLTYDKDVQVDGSVIGLTSDFELTPALAKFLSLNHLLIRERTMSVEALIDDYRHSLLAESQSKADALSYQFLCSVYSSPKSMRQLTDILLEERNLKLREMFVEHENAIIAANERMTFVSRSEAGTWWYLFWDDLWRRNNSTVSNLKLHASDFDPSYPSSIAYRLLPRAALETFLIQRGLMSKKGSWTDFMHSGILNKIYFRLNQIVFKASSDNAIHYHLGNNMAQIDVLHANSTSSRHAKSSILGTGGGTDYNDSQIRPRPLYRWEAIYDDPVAPSGKPHKRWLPKLVTWLGLDPYWEPNSRLSSGISLDVVLKDGNYVLLENAVHDFKSQMR